MSPERISTGRGTSAREARASRVAGLYAVTPDTDDTARLVADVTAAIDGGARVIQYRNKSQPSGVRLAQAQALARETARRRVLLIINDDPQLAHAVDADGAHVGADDPDLAAARDRIGPDLLLGVSCYDDFNRACAAVRDGADYVAFGSFFASAVKPGATRAGIGLLGRARALGVPVVAIGGITAANASELIDAGAHAVAVISAVFAHRDPARVRQAAAEIAALFAPASRASGSDARG